MKKIMCTLMGSLMFVAQLKAQDKKNETRLTFSEWAGYYSNGSVNTSNTSESIGHTIGILAYLSAPYKDYNDNELTLGWHFNVGGGWNLTRQKAAKYNADIGFWASKIIAPNVEVGLQYSFLGVYSYQNTSFFGSGIRPAVRVSKFQVAYGREGEGVFIGWLSPKYPTSYTNTISAKYFIGKKLFVGGNFTKYNWNKEFAVVAGLTAL